MDDPFPEIEGVEPPNREERKAMRELRDFAHKYFPQYLRLPFSSFHHYLFLRRIRKMRQPLPERRGEIDVVVAPRGAAKSTLMAQLFPVHALVEQKERYILIVSATHRQSRARLASIRGVLKSSKPLAEAYPDLEKPWAKNTSEAIEVLDVRIEACSAGSELRGLAYGPWRPTWIILDDIEDSRRILSPHYRDDLFDWMREVIEYLGDSFTHIDLIGTLLHRDAMPKRLEMRPEIRHRLFRSIIRDADRQELWQEWHEVIRQAGGVESMEKGRKFFEARREEMLRGAEVLWPEKEDYYDLQLMRFQQGDRAFDKEKQNEPHFDGSSSFDLEKALRFSIIDGAIVPDDSKGELIGGDDRIFPVKDLTLYGFLDPAKGGSKGRGDFACIATVGRHRDGRIFVLDVWLERAPPSRQVFKIFDLHARWHYTLFGVESTGFQSMLMDHIETERRFRRNVGQISDLPAQPVPRHEKKEHRIMRMEPHFISGRILLANDLHDEFIRQMETFPGGDHDDGPDALEGAVKLALDGEARERSAAEVTHPRRTEARKF